MLSAVVQQNFVRPSVRLSACLSVTFRYVFHAGALDLCSGFRSRPWV